MCFKGVPRGVKGVSRVFQGCFNGVSKMCQECSEVVSSLVQGCFKDDEMMFL